MRLLARSSARSAVSERSSRGTASSLHDARLRWVSACIFTGVYTLSDHGSILIDSSIAAPHAGYSFQQRGCCKEYTTQMDVCVGTCTDISLANQCEAGGVANNITCR